MDDDARPRRRLTPGGPRRSNPRNTDPWILTIVAAIVVVAGGWFLGQGLAHILGGRGEQPAPGQSAAPPASPAASPSQTATPTAAPMMKPAPKVTHPPARKTEPPQTPSPQPTTTPTPVTMPSPMHPATPVPHTPAPAIRTAKPAVHTAAPVHVTATRPPSAPPQQAASNAGEQTVRGYISALMRGDPQTASQYLGNGEPDESFIDSSTRITSLNSTRESDGSYTVTVSMQTSRGPYNETFLVSQSAGGPRILQKTASKP